MNKNELIKFVKFYLRILLSIDTKKIAVQYEYLRRFKQPLTQKRQ
jgi:hypothetical protein